ncbi:MAG: STAS domain-containing protein [Planctomycetota bacterium]
MAERRVGFSWHTVKGITTIRLDTSLSASALDRESAVEKLNEIVNQSQKKVILDMDAVEMIDSRMLAAIVSINRKLHSDGGQLRLCRVTPLVRNMLDTFGLLKVLHLDETEKEATNALNELGDGSTLAS